MRTNLLNLLAALALSLSATLWHSDAQAADADCVENGGKSGCSQPQTGAWSISSCPTQSWNTNNTAVYCVANGGSWNGTLGTCNNLAVATDSGIAVGQFINYLMQWEDACGVISSGSSTTFNTVGCGAMDGAETINGAASRIGTYYGFEGYNNPPACNFHWTSGLVVYESRSVTCAPGHSPRTGPGGAMECVSTPGSAGGGGAGAGGVSCPTCSKVGNPIVVNVGAKEETERDYGTGAPGTLSFTRHYNSAGYFSRTPRAITNEDNWRHSFASSVLDYQGNAYVMAAVLRPDLTVRYFNLAGVEIQNNDGAAYRLQKLTSGGTLTGWQLTTPDSDVEVYDAQGRLASITTRSGFATTLAYNGSGQLQTVTDTFGRTLAFTYNSDGQMATMTDPAGRQFQYGYDSNKRLSTVTYPDTTVRTYLYEHATFKFLLTGIVDERGIRISTYNYDSIGRASSTEHVGGRNKYTVQFGSASSSSFQVIATDAFGATITYWFAIQGGTHKMTQQTNSQVGAVNRTFDANGNPLTVTDARNMVTNYVYDGTRNLQTSRTEAYGTAIARTITTTWHPTHRLPATITEPSGVAGTNLVTTFTYDTAGNLTKKNLTAGAKVREWNYTYNARGQVLTIDGPRTDATDVSTITYYADNDACVGCRGQIYTVTNAAGHVTTFNTYNLDSRPTQITDANGVVTTMTYKSRGWLESRTVAGETTTFDYDSAGSLTKVTQPDGSWVTYQYDADKALVGMDDAMGNAADYELDIMGNRVRERYFDPQETVKRTLQRLYDGGNRLQHEVQADGYRTSYQRDGNGNATTVTDPLFRNTTNTFDSLNRLTNVLDSANGNTVFTYDAKDRLLTVKDPKISTTTGYTYDGLGNLVTQVSPDTGTTSFTHDGAGNVSTQTDARSTQTTYTYDALNRVTASTVTDGTVSYEYDNTTTGGAYAKGRLTKITDPSGNTTYAYDALGRVTSKTQTVTATPANKSFAVGYSYSSGRQTGVTYPSGRAIGYGFNAQGQVTSITVDGSTTVLSNAEYFPFGGISKWTWGNGQLYQRTFDLDGRVKTLTLGPDTGTYADLSQVFGYDSLNRLLNANLAAGQTQSFTYDSNSNRLSATINAATTSYTYPGTSHKLSSLSGATTRSFTYDNSGNVTASAGVTYVYDGRGRMKQAGTTTYLVNGLGQRVKKSSTGDTYFAYDEAGRLIGEYDTTGAPIQEMVWLSDVPVAVIKPNTPSGFTVFNVWADHLGTPRLVTDTANQSRWEWAHNDPFGANLADDNPAGLGSFTFNLRFPGQYYDAETGKHYNYQRDFDPAIGRYLQSDPLGIDGGLNTYAYVMGRPLTYIDPEGLTGAVGAIGMFGGGGSVAGGGAAAGAGGAAGVGGAGLGAALGGGAAVGAAFGLGYGLGSLLYPGFEPILSPAIDWICSQANDREKRCEQNYKRDNRSCKAISNAEKKGKRPPGAGARCYAASMQRYSNCLAGRDDSPLDTWNN